MTHRARAARSGSISKGQAERVSKPLKSPRIRARDRKGIHSTADVMAAHRKLAAEFGNQADAVVRAARERQQYQEKPAQPVDRARESVTFSRDKNFEREAVVDERALIRDGLRRGMGEVTYSQVRANLNTRLSAGEFQLVERPCNSPARQFTTAKTIAAEHEILRRVGDGRNQMQPVLSRSQAIAVAEGIPISIARRKV